MKNLIQINAIVSILFLLFSCKTYQEILPQMATIIVPAKGEIELFKNVDHDSFRIYLINQSTKNSCEAYIVKNGFRKWISPSLSIKGKLNFSVSSSASVLLQNYSDENISIIYTVK